MPPSPLRIAILEADTPLPHVLETHGTYGDIFTSLLHKAADALSLPRGQLKISKWDVETKMEYPELEDVDAVLITGSRKSRPLLYFCYSLERGNRFPSWVYPKYPFKMLQS